MQAELKLTEIEELERLLEGGWRDIASAPKDGTVIIVALIRGGVVRRVNEAKHNGVNWYSITGDGMYAPTHWMLLPPAPTGGQ